MAVRKSVPNGAVIKTDTATPASLGEFSSLAGDPLPVVNVNKANLNEIKGALDDVVKKVGPSGSPTGSDCLMLIMVLTFLRPLQLVSACHFFAHVIVLVIFST